MMEGSLQSSRVLDYDFSFSSSTLSSIDDNHASSSEDEAQDEIPLAIFMHSLKLFADSSVGSEILLHSKSKLLKLRNALLAKEWTLAG